MTAKEYLDRIRLLEKRISAMKMRSEEYDRLSLSIPGQDFTRERVDHTPSYEAPFVKWIMKKHDIDMEISKLEAILKDMQAEALLKIEELPNEDFKNVLVLRYLKYMKWEEICESLFASRRTIMRWHESALELLKI